MVMQLQSGHHLPPPLSLPPHHTIVLLIKLLFNNLLLSFIHEFVETFCVDFVYIMKCAVSCFSCAWLYMSCAVVYGYTYRVQLCMVMHAVFFSGFIYTSISVLPML